MVIGEIATCISHAPWLPDRVLSMARLRAQLGIAPGPYREETERAANYVWSLSQWEWAAKTESENCLFLQDDAIVPGGFYTFLRAMIDAVPGEVIGLQTVHPAAQALAREGHRWFTTSDALVGVGYVLPTALLREFLAWRSSALKPGAVERINEDTLLGLWCTVTGRQIWHPLPTIIDHDVEQPSTYGNDGHTARRPLVRWDTASAPDVIYDGMEEGWSTAGKIVPHLGRFPGWTVPQLALAEVEGVTPADVARWMADDGRKVLRQLEYARRAREPAAEPKRRIYIAVPHRGSTHPEHTRSIVTLCATTSGVEFVLPTAIETYAQTGTDLVRARSRMVRQFLDTDCTDLLFLDADISFDVAAIAGMLATERDVVLCPYPKRQGGAGGAIHWENVAKAAPEYKSHPESRAYAYALRVVDGGDQSVQPDGTVEIAGFGLGCCLISRSCLEKMAAYYEAADGFDDRFLGKPVATVGLFKQIHEGRELHSEDYSFCYRWRAMGGKIAMYLGPGSPVTHNGDHAFRGHLEAFGLRRG